MLGMSHSKQIGSLGIITTHQVQGVNEVNIAYIIHTLKYSGLLQKQISFQEDIDQGCKLPHIVST